MKTRQVNISVLILACFAWFFSGAATAANVQTTMSEDISKSQTKAGYNTQQAVYLQEELTKMALQTGIKFTISTDISHDKVTPLTQNKNWNVMIRNLLLNYNWVAIQDGNILKTVIITGKKGDYMTPILEPTAEPADAQTIETSPYRKSAIKPISVENRLDVANGRKVILEQYEFSGDN